MGKRRGSLDILLLFDVQSPPPPGQDFTDIFKEEDWKPEARLVSTLKSLGHEVRTFGLHDDIRPLLDEIHKKKPDLVFNQCEAFRGDRDLEPSIPAMLDLLGVRYTGASSQALALCKDKALTKKILSYHRIRIPRFLVSKKSRPIKKLAGFKYPAFTKPLNLEASEGIAQMSFTENEKDTIERVKFLHESLKCDVIIEEYIEGRELYVGVLGREKLRVLPPRELFFAQIPEGEPKFATFKAKWDDNYRKKWGIKTGSAKAIDPKIEEHILDTCKKIYKLFEIKSFARIDLRLTPEGEVVFIEANPNPSIAFDDDFAMAADRAGLSYTGLIEQIVALAL